MREEGHIREKRNIERDSNRGGTHKRVRDRGEMCDRECRFTVLLN